MPKNIASENIEIPKAYNALERRAIARDVIEYVRKRTKDGKGENNQSWRGSASKYSSSYQKSLDFKLKADKGKVNLTLSGDMLTAIDMLQNKKGKIQIGIPFGAQEWGRAKGNILGSYGKSPDPSKERPFLKISKNEIKEILKNYPLGQNREENLDKLKTQDKILKES